MRYSDCTLTVCSLIFCFAYLSTMIMSVNGDENECIFVHQIKDHPAKDRLMKLAGKSYSVSDNMDTYMYKIGICTDAESIPYAGIVQRKTSDPTNSAVIVGKRTHANFMAGNNWILLEYLNGLNYTGGICNNEPRRGSIMILCDPNETQGSMQLVEENTDRNTECYFLFELTHAAVCPVGGASSTGLSSGSVFVIVFCTLAGVYLLGGFAYQRFVAGAKGWEQMPHHEFWRDFGNLLADGCDLVCRGGSSGRIQSTPASREYKGIGDDQLASDDFDRDEHLLPM